MKKNQLEDIFIIFLILGAIYGVFSFFSSGDEEVIENKPIKIEEKIETPKVAIEAKEEAKENITKEIVPEEKINEIKKEEPIVEVKEEIPAIVSPKTLVNESMTINDFYKEIETKLQIIVDKKVQSNNYFNTKDGYVNIRLTILKDGSFEQLRYQDGDLAFYDFIKKDIQSFFPVIMYQNLEDKFPRYFRMKVVY